MNIQVLAHTFFYFSRQSPLTLKYLLYLDTCLCIPSTHHVAAGYSTSILKVFIFFRSVYQKGVPSFLKTGKSPTVPGPDCTEDVRRCRNGIAHATRLVSDGQYADVHCRATEQFHARTCLFGKITEDLIGLQKTKNTSHLTVGGILNRHSYGHSCLALTT